MKQLFPAYLVDYTMAVDPLHARYLIYLEARNLMPSRIKSASKALHLEISKRNNTYLECDRLQMPKVSFLRSGMFETLYKFRLSKLSGVSRSQLKIQRLLTNADEIKLLESQVEFVSE